MLQGGAINLLLFTADELNSECVLMLKGRRAEHLLNVLSVEEDDEIKVGMVGGNVGRAKVIYTCSKIEPTVFLVIQQLNELPPEPLPLSLILGLPRPKMLRRVLHSAIELGIKEFHIIHSFRVEKSYWQSPLLTEQAVQQTCFDALSQCGDTRLPVFHRHRRFKPFVEDVLPQLAQQAVAESQAWIAHPSVNQRKVPGLNPEGQAFLAIGPEGGFIPYEVEKFIAAGFSPFSYGKRILRVETAVPAICGGITKQ